MVDEMHSGWSSRWETRRRLDESLDRVGEVHEGVLNGLDPEQVMREQAENDPSNETGAAALGAIAAQAGGR